MKHDRLKFPFLFLLMLLNHPSTTFFFGEGLNIIRYLLSIVYSHGVLSVCMNYDCCPSFHSEGTKESWIISR